MTFFFWLRWLDDLIVCIYLTNFKIKMNKKIEEKKAKYSKVHLSNLLAMHILDKIIKCFKSSFHHF